MGLCACLLALAPLHPCMLALARLCARACGCTCACGCGCACTCALTLSLARHLKLCACACALLVLACLFMRLFMRACLRLRLRRACAPARVHTLALACGACTRALALAPFLCLSGCACVWRLCSHACTSQSNRARLRSSTLTKKYPKVLIMIGSKSNMHLQQSHKF